MPKPYTYSDNEMMFHYTIDEHPNPAAFEMHTHDRCEIYLFLSGKGSFWVEGSRYKLTPGDILLLRPYESHCIEVDPHLPYERAVLHFHPSLIDKTDRDYGLLISAFYDRGAGKSNLLHASDFEDGFVMHCFERIMERENQPRLNIVSHLYPILYEIHRTRSKVPHIDPMPEEEPLSYRILQHINQHITDPLSLDDICKEFYISKSQLCRIFKKSVGSTVWHYITLKRLMMAKQQITEGESPTVVCTRCGFTDYSVFWRAYRTQFGVSPKNDAPETEKNP